MAKRWKYHSLMACSEILKHLSTASDAKGFCPPPDQSYERTCQDVLHASSLDGPWKRTKLNLSGWDWSAAVACPRSSAAPMPFAAPFGDMAWAASRSLSQPLTWCNCVAQDQRQPRP